MRCQQPALTRIIFQASSDTSRSAYPDAVVYSWFPILKKAIQSESSVLGSRERESEESMKKAERIRADELRAEYKRSDFAGPLVRGKYAKRLRESSNIVVLRPEVAAVFRNAEAVNRALMSLVEVAQAATRPPRRLSRRANTRN